MSASSGTIAHVTESAVRAASTANRSTDMAPCIGPRRPQTMPAATTAAPSSTIRTSTTVVRASWVPPAAPKAAPASAPPRRAAASHSGRAPPRRRARVAGGLASASESGERNTRDLGQERDARQRRDAFAHGHESTDQGHEGERDERHEQRYGKVVAGAGQVEESVRAGLHFLAADLGARWALPRVGRDGGQVLVVLGAGGLLLGGQRAAVRAYGRTVAALVGSTRDRVREELAAVAVLVEVRGEVVDRLAELAVRPLLVEVAVAAAVAERSGQRAAGQRQQGEHREDKQACCGSDHGFGFPPTGGGGGREKGP